MKRLEFHISYICNHSCIFCSEYDRLEKYNKFPLTILQIKTILLDRRKKWYNHVNFTWWEPTIIPWFLDLLKFAKKVWYKIYVWSNWTMFASEEFSKESLNYIDELSLSIHWYDKKSCLEQTWNKNHFDNFKLIASNINNNKQNNFFFSNIVLNNYNYKDIINILKFIKESYFPVKQILISNIAPEWLADNNYANLVFDLVDFKTYITDIINFCNANNLILRFFWIPICILGEENKQYSNDTHWEERHTIERFTDVNWKVVLQDIYSPDNSRKRSFVDKCDDCKFRANPCTWFFKKYLDCYNA